MSNSTGCRGYRHLSQVPIRTTLAAATKCRPLRDFHIVRCIACRKLKHTKERLICLTDGSTRIKNRLEDYNPEAAKEWFKTQTELLYESEVEQVIQNIRATTAKKRGIKIH